MVRKILGYFFNGLLVTIPLGLIVYLFYISFIKFDAFLRMKVLGDSLSIPGIGLLFFIIFIAGVGFLSTSFLFKPLFTWFEKTIEGIPLIKTIYTAINDLLSAFVGKKKRFNKPVLVKMDAGTEIERIGFVTDEDLNFIQNKEGKVGVYFPYSYGIMGALYIVPTRNISMIDENPADIMKYIVSGGISETDNSE